jgi:hypothetical protein
MESTLIILFVGSALLLILSIILNRKASKQEHKEIDMVHMSLMKEINQVQESIRNNELDLEIFLKEAEFQLSSEEIIFKREVLDLYKRKYSIESIAEKKQATETEIVQLLAPYLSTKDERSEVVYEN